MNDTAYTLQIMVMPHSWSPVTFAMHPGGYVAVTRDPSQNIEYRAHGKTPEEAIAAVAKQFIDGQPKPREIEVEGKPREEFYNVQLGPGGMSITPALPDGNKAQFTFNDNDSIDTEGRLVD